jgi:hypothetical protein
MNKIVYFLLISFIAPLYAHLPNICSEPTRKKFIDLQRQIEKSLTGKIINAACGYGIIGYGLTTIGTALHALSNAPSYEKRSHFGLHNNIKYPSYTAPTIFKHHCSNTAKHLLTLGAIIQWPLRSSRELIDGTLIQSGRIAIMKYDLDVTDLETKGIIKGMKNMRKHTLLKTPMGIVAGITPIALYHLYEKHTESSVK